MSLPIFHFPYCFTASVDYFPFSVFGSGRESPQLRSRHYLLTYYLHSTEFWHCLFSKRIQLKTKKPNISLSKHRDSNVADWPRTTAFLLSSVLQMTIEDFSWQEKEKKKEFLFFTDFFLAHCGITQSENSKSRIMTKISYGNTIQQKLLFSSETQSLIAQL